MSKNHGARPTSPRFSRSPVRAARLAKSCSKAPTGRTALLVKYIFTSDRLSIQVHPNDAQAVDKGLLRGKEEIWHILDCEPGATLGIGLTAPMIPDQFGVAAQDGSLEQWIDWKPVKPGDYFFIPAGTVHAIVAGITLAEIQQNSDITYRLYDYGRPRELHLEDGVAVSHLVPYDRAPGKTPLGSETRLIGDGEAPFSLDLSSGTKTKASKCRTARPCGSHRSAAQARLMACPGKRATAFCWKAIAPSP